MIILFRSSYVFNLRNAWKQWSKFQRIVTIIFITMGTNNRYYISLLLDFQNRNRVRYYGRFPRLNGLCKIRREERFLISFIRCNKIYISILSFFFSFSFLFEYFSRKESELYDHSLTNHIVKSRGFRATRSHSRVSNTWAKISCDPHSSLLKFLLFSLS